MLVHGAFFVCGEDSPDSMIHDWQVSHPPQVMKDQMSWTENLPMLHQRRLSLRKVGGKRAQETDYWKTSSQWIHLHNSWQTQMNTYKHNERWMCSVKYATLPGEMPKISKRSVLCILLKMPAR